MKERLAGPDRRAILRSLAAAGLAPYCVAAQAAQVRRIKAVAFDGFAIFDPRPVAALARELYPERGAELSALWRTKQFEYTWLRTISRRYADFHQITEQALDFAARALQVELTPGKRDRLVGQYLQL